MPLTYMASGLVNIPMELSFVVSFGFLFIWFWPLPASLRAYSSFFTQGTFLVGLGDHMEHRKFN